MVLVSLVLRKKKKPCSVGELWSSSCESTRYIKNNDVLLVSDSLSNEQQELLKWQTSLELIKQSTFLVLIIFVTLLLILNLTKGTAVILLTNILLQ